MNIIKNGQNGIKYSQFGAIRIIEKCFYEMGFAKISCVLCLSLAIQYLCGMILLDKCQTIDGIAKAFGKVSNDTLALGLHYFRLFDSSFFINMVKAIQSKTMEAGYLIVDDVTIVKFGKKIEVCGKIYDHVTKKHCLGFMIVVILWTNGTIKIPLQFRIWKCKAITGEKNYKTKMELTYEMLDYINNVGLSVRYVAFDSWYCGKPFLKRLRDTYGYDFITRIKCNRKIWFDDLSLQVRWLDMMLPKGTFRYYQNVGLYLRSVEVYLPGYGDIKLCIVHKEKKSNVKNSKYIVTNMPLSTQNILLHYASRWSIEVFFRDMKQSFGLSKFQFRKERMIEPHIMLLFIGYLICQKLMNDISYKTIGAVIRYLQGIIEVERNGKIELVETRFKEVQDITDRTTIWKKIST